MITKSFIGIFGLLLCVGGEMFSQETYSLKQALEYAYSNSLELKNTQLDEERMIAQKNEIRGIGLPQISASFDLKDYIELPTSLLPAEFFGGQPGTFIPINFGTQYNADAGVSASQIIFNGDYVVALQSSKVFIELTKKATYQTKLDVTEKVSKAYYMVLVNDQRAELLTNNISQLQKLFDDTQVMYNTGYVEQVDVDRLQVSINNLRSEDNKLKKLIGLSRTLLKFQMGMSFTETIELSDKLEDLQLNSLSINSTQPLDFSKRNEYSMMQSQRMVNELKLRRNKYSYLPSLVAYGNLTTQAQRTEFNIFDTSERWFAMGLVGAKLSLPIFSGTQRKYQTQQSKIELLQVENNIKLLEQGIDIQYSSAKVMLENSIESLENEKANMELAQRIYDTLVVKYNEGLGSNLEVVTAETALKNSTTNYHTALYDAIIAKIDLDKALGNLIK